MGAISYIKDKKEDRSIIYALSIKNSFKEKGLSHYLYQYMLEDLVKNKISHYIGHSSTNRVLKLAKKMNRVELNRAYIVNM